MKQCGFTLIEILMFIVVSSLLLSTIFLGSSLALRSAPLVHRQWIALQTARGCMEWFLDQRRLNNFSTLSCPSTPSTSECLIPNGFNVSASITCTTRNGDSNFKTVTINVTGLASASLSTEIGDY